MAWKLVFGADRKKACAAIGLLAVFAASGCGQSHDRSAEQARQPTGTELAAPAEEDEYTSFDDFLTRDAARRLDRDAASLDDARRQTSIPLPDVPSRGSPTEIRILTAPFKGAVEIWRGHGRESLLAVSLTAEPKDAATRRSEYDAFVQQYKPSSPSATASVIDSRRSGLPAIHLSNELADSFDLTVGNARVHADFPRGTSDAMDVVDAVAAWLRGHPA